MSWEIGYDTRWRRDIGYGVPALCDHPDCNREIDRGLGYVCGGQPYGGERGCGLYFCDRHLYLHTLLCDRCMGGDPPFPPKPDTAEWTKHKATHPSWAKWRKQRAAEAWNPERENEVDPA